MTPFEPPPHHPRPQGDSVTTYDSGAVGSLTLSPAEVPNDRLAVALMFALFRVRSLPASFRTYGG